LFIATKQDEAEGSDTFQYNNLYFKMLQYWLVGKILYTSLFAEKKMK